MAMSAAMYATLIVVLVGGAVQLQRWLAPAFFPVTWAFSDPLSELPFDLLLFHFAVPYALEYFRPREARGPFCSLVS
jgi:hypothetical protein